MPRLARQVSGTREALIRVSEKRGGTPPALGWATSRAVATTLVVLAIGVEAHAQDSGTIAGMVKDASGGVLPGVLVEATSPALIEKARTVVTDGAGQYKIVLLPSGVYFGHKCSKRLLQFVPPIL